MTSKKRNVYRFFLLRETLNINATLQNVSLALCVFSHFLRDSI